MNDSPDQLQSLCLAGQEHLEAMRYLQDEAALLQAESAAVQTGDWDTVARLYMPLQECRRQRRQRCGEGTIKLDFVAQSESESPDAAAIARQVPHGQLLIAGWGTIEPALQFREVAAAKQLYVETFLAAVYPITGGGRAVAVLPNAAVAVPAPEEMPIDRLIQRLPPHSVLLPIAELPKGARMGDTATFAHTMSLWERLHKPFLAMAEATRDLRQRITAYRRTIEIDYACELAHQKLSNTARQLAREKAGGA